jgi:hypothetical protein
VAVFSGASFGAWILGRTDVARERENQMMAIANEDNAHEAASAQMYAASLRVQTGECEQTVP